MAARLQWRVGNGQVEMREKVKEEKGDIDVSERESAW